MTSVKLQQAKMRMRMFEKIYENHEKQVKIQKRGPVSMKDMRAPLPSEVVETL